MFYSPAAGFGPSGTNVRTCLRHVCPPCVKHPERMSVHSGRQVSPPNPNILEGCPYIADGRFPPVLNIPEGCPYMGRHARYPMIQPSMLRVSGEMLTPTFTTGLALRVFRYGSAYSFSSICASASCGVEPYLNSRM